MKAKLITTEISVPGSGTPAKLTPGERVAVEAFLKAVENLPKSLCIHLEDFVAKDECHLTLHKRVTKGFAVFVGGIRKRSLIFP